MKKDSILSINSLHSAVRRIQAKLFKFKSDSVEGEGPSSVWLTITNAPNRVFVSRLKLPAPKFRLALLLVLAAVVLGGIEVSAATPPALKVVEAPSSAVAGSAGNVLAFVFTAANGASAGTASIIVPASWSEPQNSNPSVPGYVMVSSSSCNTAAVSSISAGAAGPWVISLQYKCAARKSFQVTYIATAPTPAGPYSFGVVVPEGPHTVQSVSVVNVIAGPAKSLTLTGLTGAMAGTPQSATVTAFDAYNNQATGYLGTVHFASSDLQASLPANYGFTVADAGSHTFFGLVVLKTAQLSSVSVGDIATAKLSGSENVTISPGPAAKLSLGIPQPAKWGAGQFNVGLDVNCDFSVFDAYSNPVTNYGGTVKYSSSDPKAQIDNFVMPYNFGPLPAGAVAFSACNLYTAGPQTITITDIANPAMTDTKSITCLGPIANPLNISILSPTSNDGITLDTLELVGDRIYNEIFFNHFTLVSVDQLTYTQAGVTYQVGVTSITPDNKVLWNLNPPDGTTPSVAGATLVTCTPTTDSCNTPTPAAANYTIADPYGNQNSNTITAQISTPDIPIAPSSVTLTVIGANGFALPGGIVGTNLTFTLTTPLSLNPNTNVATIPFSANTACPAAGAKPPCSLNVNANVYMSAGTLVAGTGLTGLDLTQPLQVTGPPPPAFLPVSSATVSSGSQLSTQNVGLGIIYNIDPPECTDSTGAGFVCPQTDGNVALLQTIQSGVTSVAAAFSIVENALFLPQSSCTSPVPPGQVPDVVVGVSSPSSTVADTPVVLTFYSNNCPTNW